MRNKVGGKKGKGLATRVTVTGHTAYPSVDPGRNAAGGVKYAISNLTTAAVPSYCVGTAL